MGNKNSSNTNDVNDVLGNLERLERRVESIHAMQRQEVAAVTRVLAENQYPIQHPEVVVFGAKTKRGNANVLVGPIVGVVTDRFARIMIEVDRTTKLLCHVCIVNAECPSGLEVTQVQVPCSAKKPTGFYIENLDSGVEYRFCFSGLVKEDSLERVGRFVTMSPQASLTFGAVFGNLSNYQGKWDKTALSILGTRSDSSNLDIILHLGGQVDFRRKLQYFATMIERMNALDRPTADLELRITEELRSVFRVMWNEKSMRQILSQCSNLIMPTDLELTSIPCRNTALYLDSENDDYYLALSGHADVARITYPSALQRLVRSVYEEYHDAICASKVTEGQLHLGYFHRLNSVAGILSIDIRSAQLDGKGRATNSASLVTAEQWSFIMDSLSRNYDLGTLIVVTDRPIVARTTCPENPALTHDSWVSHGNDLSTLLRVLFSWRSQATIILVSGVGPYSVGTKTVLRAEGFSRTEIMQMSIPSMSKCYAGADLKLLDETPVNNVIQMAVIDRQIPADFFEEGTLSSITYEHVATHSDVGKCYYGLIENEGKSVYGMLSANVLVAGEESVDTGPKVTMGPVVGLVTDSTAVVMIEVAEPTEVVCVVVEGASRKVTKLSEASDKGCLIVYKFTELESDKTYSIHFPAVPGLEGVFHTLTSDSDAMLSKKHELRLMSVHSTLPVHTRDSVPLWKAFQSHVNLCNHKMPVTCFHYGPKLSLRFEIADALQTVIRYETDGYGPLGMDQTRLDEIVAKFKGILRKAFRDAWSLPGMSDILKSCSNVFVPCLQDYELPGSFETDYYLREWFPLLQDIVHEVVADYYDKLNGGSQVIYLRRSIGCISLCRTRPTQDTMLGSTDWAQLLENIEHRAVKLKTLILISDAPICDDSILDAKTKGEDSDFVDEMRAKWPFYEDECMRLLDLLFSWMVADSTRQVFIIAAHPRWNFETVLSRTFEQTLYSIKQYCYAPFLTSIPDNDKAEFPYEESGTMDAKKTIKGDVLVPKYNFTHTPGGALASFGVLRCSMPAGKHPGYRVEYGYYPDLDHIMPEEDDDGNDLDKDSDED